MPNPNIQWNGTAIETAMLEAFTSANQVFGRKAAREITSDKWDWPTAPSPRDIVDEGGLRNSYTPTQVNPTTYDHAWTVDYAMAVHEGATRSGASLPARPWTRDPLADLPSDFEKLAKTELGRVK